MTMLNSMTMTEKGSMGLVCGDDYRCDNKKEHGEEYVHGKKRVGKDAFFFEHRFPEKEVENDKRESSEPDAPEIGDIAQKVDSVEAVEMQDERIRKSVHFDEEEYEIYEDDDAAHSREYEKRSLSENRRDHDPHIPYCNTI